MVNGVKTQTMMTLFLAKKTKRKAARRVSKKKKSKDKARRAKKEDPLRRMKKRILQLPHLKSQTML